MCFICSGVKHVTLILDYKADSFFHSWISSRIHQCCSHDSMDGVAGESILHDFVDGLFRRKMSELERLAKAIETVKNEVEESQKQLLLYTKATHPEKDSAPELDSNCNELEAAQDTAKITKKKCDTLIAPKNKKLAHKYVVDRSCPATDLEYDPLLNYTAGFFGSNAKENQEESAKESQEESAEEQMPEEEDDGKNKKSRDVSPIRLTIELQESGDEDMLVIDAPPLEVVSKRQRPNKIIAAEECVQPHERNASEEEKVLEDRVEYESLPPMTNSSDVDTSSENRGEFDVSEKLPTRCTSGSAPLNEDPSDSCISSEANIVNIKESTNSTKKSSESTAVTDEQASLQCKDEESSSCILPEETLMACDSEDFQESSKEFEIDSAAMNTTVETSAADMLLTDEPKCQLEAPCLPQTDESEVIVLTSSDTEEDDTASESDDPMEECLRIFNEFAEREAKKNANQAVHCGEDQPNAEVHEVKGDLIPIQKKRIAHPSAKGDMKESGTILVPYRGPAPPVPKRRILHVQQEAVQISSAVRSGQAFVASSQRRVSSCLPPALHNFGHVVCVNLLEVKPILPSRGQLIGVSHGNAFATTLKPVIPQKRAIQTNPIKIPCRRKTSTSSESSNSKVPHETRQRYVNSFVEEFLKESTSVEEAFNKALAEEKAIYDRCGSKNMYLNIAVNSLKKLRDQHSNSPDQSKQDDKNELTGRTLYNYLKDYLLSEDQLINNGYPRPNPDKPNSALIHSVGAKNVGGDALRRVCSRCGEVYAVTIQGKHVRKEECIFHSGRVLRHKVPGGLETRYNCCEAVVGAPGCQMAKLHVHDGQKDNLDGFIKTFPKLQPSDGNPGIFAVDCEMSYTTQGLELTRVTVVNHNLQVVYDTFVKPDNEIIDYNTKLSGITEEHLKNITTSIRDVQAILLNLFSAETILIGHSLENDLIALKLIHDTVVDTSIVFPHRLGLPHKRALRNLIADYLRRIIQDSVDGHDSSEDATACMELMIWKVKEDTKGRR
ncbi:RNA exonuclease 1 homolog [Hyperolius riggenbachi]|uniref:RNA exonuclease 1 homolog n=1 Tax=Hyperolius riggenbachi TaxID=752182 RepID=UPI0035A358E6